MRWKRILIIGVPIFALSIAVITVKFADTETSTASNLGSGLSKVP
jgi:hypothetical protein